MFKTVLQPVRNTAPPFNVICQAGGTGSPSLPCMSGLSLKEKLSESGVHCDVTILLSVVDRCFFTHVQRMNTSGEDGVCQAVVLASKPTKSLKPTLP